MLPQGMGFISGLFLSYMPAEVIFAAGLLIYPYHNLFSFGYYPVFWLPTAIRYYFRNHFGYLLEL